MLKGHPHALRQLKVQRDGHAPRKAKRGGCRDSSRPRDVCYQSQWPRGDNCRDRDDARPTMLGHQRPEGSSAADEQDYLRNWRRLACRFYLLQRAEHSEREQHNNSTQYAADSV